MKKLLGFLIVLVLLIVAAAAYLGIVPGISPLLAKPKDLGQTVDKNLVTTFETKYGAKSGEDRVDLDVTLSNQELTSIFAVWEDRDVNFPLYNTQIRINEDGTGEASGMLRISTAISLAKNLGYSDSDIEKGKEYIKYVAGDIPFYVKGTGGMTDNKLTLTPSTVEIGRISLPASITNPLKSLVGDMVERRLTQIGGVDIQEASLVPSGFKISGNVPATINY